MPKISFDLNSEYYDKLHQKLVKLDLVGFRPTKNDVRRTNDLAKKNLNSAFLLAAAFGPFVGFYTGRAVNSLKIIGIGFGAFFTTSLITYRIDAMIFGWDYDALTPLSDLVGALLATAMGFAVCLETVAAIDKARARLQTIENSNLEMEPTRPDVQYKENTNES